jgi:hypothetical protein
MVKLELDCNQFKEIIKKGYSLDHIFLLQLVKEGRALDELGPKIENINNALIRKGLVFDNKLTLEGEEVLKYLSTPYTGLKLEAKKTKEKDDSFSKWWEAFPSTDTFKVGNKLFKGTRSLKAKKEDCKAKLKAILNEGEYTVDDLINALKLEVHQKAENSLKTGQNKLSFMQNSLTYLNQRTFESYVDLYKSGIGIEIEKIKAPVNTFDI